MVKNKEISFWRYLAQFRFCEALGSLGPVPELKTGCQQWACYWQGLFDMVIASPWHEHSIPSGFAHAVSLAAIGRTDEARKIARRLCKSSLVFLFRHWLARALAPYDPALALEVAQKDSRTLGLRVVLQSRHGSQNEAEILVKKAFEKGLPKRDPELHLLASNFLTNNPPGRLDHLNQYIASYNMSPLALKRSDRPPLVDNLIAANVLSHVSGPLVSILMTSYNTADRIGAALEGLLAQSYRNIEIIVADDASSDDTVAVLQCWAEKDCRIKYLRMPANVGTYVAKKAAFKVSQGEFVTCHDSDDWSHPQRLEMQVRPLLENPHLVATTSKWIRLEDDGSYYARLVYPMLRLNPSSPLFRREIVAREAGLWDAVRIGADSEFHSRLRLVFGKQAVRCISKPLTIGAHRENSLMTDSSTGYTSSGMSPIRLAYWESWARWHIRTLHEGQKPKLAPIEDGRRFFDAPESICVPTGDIKAALASLGD